MTQKWSQIACHSIYPVLNNLIKIEVHFLIEINHFSTRLWLHRNEILHYFCHIRNETKIDFNILLKQAENVYELSFFKL